MHTAFQGCVEDASRNIEDDAAYSYYDRYNTMTQKLEPIREILMEVLGDSEMALEYDLRGYNEVILDLCETPTTTRYAIAVSGRKTTIQKLNNVRHAMDILKSI